MKSVIACPMLAADIANTTTSIREGYNVSDSLAEMADLRLWRRNNPVSELFNLSRHSRIDLGLRLLHHHFLQYMHVTYVPGGMVWCGN